MVVLIQTWQLEASADLMRKMDKQTLRKHLKAAEIIAAAAAELKKWNVDEVMLLADSDSKVG